MNEENIVKTIQDGDYTIKIIQDYDNESPDCWGNDDVFLVYYHRQFYVERKGFDPRDIYIDGGKMYGDYHVFVVYAYIHGGVALSVGDHSFPDARWDVSSTGYMLVKKQKEWSWEREDALKIAEDECKTWNDYLSGNVYGYVVEKDGEHKDSCWGYYGDYEDSGVIEEAQSIVEYWKKKDESDALEAMLGEIEMLLTA